MHVYVVTPKCADTMMGKPLVFASLERAQAYVRRSKFQGSFDIDRAKIRQRNVSGGK